MEMEVMVAVPPPPVDFNFDSNCSSPYITTPSSPQRLNNFFFSAPTTPFHHQLNNHHSSASIPSKNNHYNQDFEFDFSGNLETPSLSAEELFHGGKIRPLKLANNESSNKKDSIEGTRKRVEEEEPQQRHKRGKESRRSLSSLNIGSVSMCCDSEDISHETVVSVSSLSNNNKKTTTSSYASFLSSISFTKGYRKWRIKDFLLFRSASEGRATNKDPLRKYAVLSKTTAPHDDVSNSSFRSTESSGSVSRRRGPVSAHELHYTVNRAASEELKKKTLLPYKQGLLGCLGFNINPGVHHISRRIGSLERS